MAKPVELLLTETIETLGIVGDVVKVRPGYARNFLLPRGLATAPSEEKIAELAEKRAAAERELAELRRIREEMVEKLEGYEITLERACNDQGLLYGSITQNDIAEALNEAGFMVKTRDVRLGQTIKRIDSYEILVKPDQDLEATIKLWVVSDRPLEVEPEEPEEAPEGEAAGETTEGAEAAGGTPPEAGEGETKTEATA